MVDRRKVLVHRPRHHKKPTPQSQIFPFLQLPLEIRIIIYKHAIADDALKPTRRRLPSLFHTNPQITREIYQYCALFAFHDVKFPNISRTKLSQLPGWSMIGIEELLSPWEKTNHDGSGVVLEVPFSVVGRHCSSVFTAHLQLIEPLKCQLPSYFEFTIDGGTFCHSKIGHLEFMMGM
ncbi:hypothetical protein KCU61_g10, partial [Aureobasidium melanogenum]